MSEVTNGYAAEDDADDEQCRLLPAFVSPGFLGNCGMVLGLPISVSKATQA